MTPSADTGGMAGIYSLNRASQELLVVHDIGIDGQGGFKLVVEAMGIVLAVHAVTEVVPIPPAVNWIIQPALPLL